MRTVLNLYIVILINTLLITVVPTRALGQDQDVHMFGGDGLALNHATVAASYPLTTLYYSRFRSQKSLDEIAIELLNPINGLLSLTVNYLCQPYQGEMPNANNQTVRSISFMPSFSFRMINGKNIVLRSTVPVNLSEPTYKYLINGEGFNDYFEYTEWRIRQKASTIPRSGEFYYCHDHLYDISFDVTYGGVNDLGLIKMVGIAGVLPTSEDQSGSRRQYLLGPNIVFGKTFERGIIGGQLIHLINVIDGSSSSDHNTKLTELKLFSAYGIGKGWQIVSNSHITYDWEGEDGNKLLLPLGVGVAKTIRIGTVLVRLVVEAQKFLETPDAFGPNWSLKLSVTTIKMKRS